ncbi:MAG: short-chain fatty acyl-CoA regulator family protein [Maritimibacter sp.]
MGNARLTGSRIRARRLAAGLKQADLARAVGISPAYLNLIEHNRRRIAGKLLHDLARELQLDPAQLSEGAEDALVTVLRGAAAQAVEAAAELTHVEDFAGRYPGWAGLAGEQARRIEVLERQVEALADRLAHDPHLATSLHEVLSAVTAIRSTAAILAGPDEIDPKWQARFLRGMREESRRLSSSAEGLVAWLDSGGEMAERPLSPIDELGAFIARAGYHFPELEAPQAGEAEISALIEAAEEFDDPDSGEFARRMLSRYLAEARAMPQSAFTASRAHRDDPAHLAASFGVGIGAVLRRMASLGGGEAGLVACDSSGTLTLRKPIDGFSLPRFGAACPFWPLFQALTRPGQPISALVEMPGRLPRRFLCRAVSLPLAGQGFDTPQVYEATMLIEPAPEDASGPVIEAGSACRVCPREHCIARREPSVLGAAAKAS